MLRNITTSFRRHRESAPPPRWQVMVASFYIGALMYLAAHLSGLL